MQGGDVGWIHESSMAEWMTKLVDPLQPGQTTDVVELPFGCTIIQLLERKQYERPRFEEVKPRLTSAVFEDKVAKQYKVWMEKLREKTFIERRGYFADAAQFGSSPFDKYRGAPGDQPGAEPGTDEDVPTP
jgi:peptidyl-prolyl cis-trans isomerase SurA